MRRRILARLAPRADRMTRRCRISPLSAGSDESSNALRTGTGRVWCASGRLPRVPARLLERVGADPRRRELWHGFARWSCRCARRRATRGAQGRLTARGGRARAPRPAALARRRRRAAAPGRPASRWRCCSSGCTAEDLGELWDVEACEIVGGLYARLHVPALPQLRTLTSYVGRWAGELAQLPRDAPLPRRLVEQAASLARDLAADDGQHRPDDPHRPALRERARRRTASPGWRSTRSRSTATRTTRSRRCCGTAGTSCPRRGASATASGCASTPWSTSPGSTSDRARDWVVVRMMVNALRSLRDEPDRRLPDPVHRDRQGGPGLVDRQVSANVRRNLSSSTA